MLACSKSAGPCSVCVSVCVCVCVWGSEIFTFGWSSLARGGARILPSVTPTLSVLFIEPCTLPYICVVCIIDSQHSVYFSLYTVLGTRTLLSMLLLLLVTPPLLLLLFIKPVRCAVFAFFGTFTTLNVWICILDRNAKTHSIAMIVLYCLHW